VEGLFKEVSSALLICKRGSGANLRMGHIRGVGHAAVFLGVLDNGLDVHCRVVSSC